MGLELPDVAQNPQFVRCQFATFQNATYILSTSADSPVQPTPCPRRIACRPVDFRGAFSLVAYRARYRYAAWAFLAKNLPKAAGPLSRKKSVTIFKTVA